MNPYEKLAAIRRILDEPDRSTVSVKMIGTWWVVEDDRGVNHGTYSDYETACKRMNEVAAPAEPKRMLNEVQGPGLDDDDDDDYQEEAG